MINEEGIAFSKWMQVFILTVKQPCNCGSRYCCCVSGKTTECGKTHYIISIKPDLCSFMCSTPSSTPWPMCVAYAVASTYTVSGSLCSFFINSAMSRAVFVERSFHYFLAVLQSLLTCDEETYKCVCTWTYTLKLIHAYCIVCTKKLNKMCCRVNQSQLS